MEKYSTSNLVMENAFIDKLVNNKNINSKTYCEKTIDDVKICTLNIKDKKAELEYNSKLGKIRNDAYRKIVACIVRYYANYDKVSYADIFNDPSLVQDKQVYDILCSLDIDEKLEEFNEEYFNILTKDLEINQRIAIVKEKIKLEKSPFQKTSKTMFF